MKICFIACPISLRVVVIEYHVSWREIVPAPRIIHSILRACGLTMCSQSRASRPVAIFMCYGKLLHQSGCQSSPSTDRPRNPLLEKIKAKFLANDRLWRPRIIWTSTS